MLKDKKIAVIGAGHIGVALIGGLLRAKLVAAKDIVAARRSPEALQRLRGSFGVRIETDNRKAARGADILILAVKPQGAPAVLAQLAPAVHRRQLILSVMAGITTETIQKRLKKPVAIIRAMPNTPVLVDAGATAVARGAHASDADLAAAKAVFGAVGSVEVLPEHLLDAVTGLSGSGPVYIYMVIEALTDGGVKMGIPRDIAIRLATQTVLGAAKLVRETGRHPAILKDEVTTPGGTAIAAIHELEAKGLRALLIDAVATATQRAKELSELYR